MPRPIDVTKRARERAGMTRPPTVARGATKPREAIRASSRRGGFRVLLRLSLRPVTEAALAKLLRDVAFGVARPAADAAEEAAPGLGLSQQQLRGDARDADDEAVAADEDDADRDQEEAGNDRQHDQDHADQDEGPARDRAHDADDRMRPSPQALLPQLHHVGPRAAAGQEPRHPGERVRSRRVHEARIS